MKKYIKLILFLFIVLLIVKFSIYIFVNKKDVSYTVVSDKKRYRVTENFKKIDQNNLYSFTVKDKKDVYHFSYNKDFHKKSKIVRNIQFYKSNHLKCILPTYSDNSISSLYCILDGRQVSYSYLKQTNNKDFDKILNSVQNKELVEKYSNSDNLVSYKNISIYEDNMVNDLVYSVWYYKGLYVVDQNGVSYEKLLKKDKYENNLARLVDRYYVIFDTDQLSKGIYYDRVIIYDIKDQKKFSLKLNDQLSIDTYINGVFGDKLYITDIDSETQYSINPKKRKVEKVGSRDSGFYTVRDGKLVVGKLKNNMFSVVSSHPDIERLYKTDEIIWDLEYYYFKTDDNTVYKVINNDYKHPIQLFHFDDIKEWKVVDGYISFIAGDTVYVYSDEVGIRPIIKDNELKYNYKNIYDFWKK